MHSKPVLAIFALLVILMLAACGGGGGGDGGTQPKPDLQGQFIDSAVQGLRYEAMPSGLTGTTNSSGTFIYKAGDTVSFYIGDMLIGSAAGAKIITPVSLVDGAANETDVVVINIARFLQSLDENKNLVDGIQIPASIADAATAMASSINFTANTFDIDAASLIADLTSAAYNEIRLLADAGDATIHLQGSLLCELSGTYSGTWVQTAGPGSDNGSWTFTVNSVGIATGSGTSTEGPFNISGTVNPNGTTEFVGGTTTNGASFTGTASLDGSVSGTWANDSFSTSGTYTGNRTAIPAAPCASTPGSSGGSTSGLGALSISGAETDTIGTTFEPNEITAPDATSIRWRTVIDGGGGQGLVTHSILFSFNLDGSANSFTYSRVIESGVTEYHYHASCGVDDCSGVTVNQTANTIRFVNVDTPAAQGLGIAASPITINGTLGYASTAFVVPGSPAVDTSAFAGIYTGTFTGEDSGSWVFIIDSIGNLTGTVISDTTGTGTFTASVSSAGVISGNGMTGTITADGSISGTWSGDTGAVGGTYSGSLDTSGTATGGTGGGAGTGSGTITLSGADVSSGSIGEAFSPVWEAAVNLGLQNDIYVTWHDWDTTIIPQPDFYQLEMQFDITTGDITSINLRFGTFFYSVNCVSESCAGLGITANTSTKEVTFASSSIPVSGITINTATAPVTLNGTITYN